MANGGELRILDLVDDYSTGCLIAASPHFALLETPKDVAKWVSFTLSAFGSLLLCDNRHHDCENGLTVRQGPMRIA